MKTDVSLEELVDRGLGGSGEAIEALVRRIQDDIYGLALRMLWHPEDAADATQEILIKVVTRLGSFRGESAFRTWCFRVACNHLLTARKSRAEARAVSFEELAEKFAGDAQTLHPRAIESTDDRLLEEEVKLRCTLGMLLCLDRDHRLAYIVGEILDLSSDEAAEVTGVPSVTYRKRLSRSRERLREFMERECGLVRPGAACRCSRYVGPPRGADRAPPEPLLFACHRERPLDARSLVPKLRELEALHESVQLYRGHPDYAAPESLAASIRDLLRARPPSMLAD